jgi:hypothetical protein
MFYSTDYIFKLEVCGTDDYKRMSKRKIYLYQLAVHLIFNWYHAFFYAAYNNGKSKFLVCSLRNVRSNFINYWSQVIPKNVGRWVSGEGNQFPIWITSLDQANQRTYVYEASNEFKNKYS